MYGLAPGESQRWERDAVAALDCFALSRVGAGRSVNQDSYLLGHAVGLPIVKERSAAEFSHAFSARERDVLLGVADGVGGRSAGEVASTHALVTAAQTVSRLLEREKDLGGEEIAKMLRWAVRIAEMSMSRYCSNRHECSGMATTLSMALLSKQEAVIVHAGDSRAYRLGARGLEQVTRDQTMEDQWYANGPGRRGELLPDHLVNVLENCLRTDGARVRPAIYRLQLEEEDQILLCSDGVSSALSHQEIEWLLVTSQTSQEAAQRLVDAARDAGSIDDTTALVAARRAA